MNRQKNPHLGTGSFLVTKKWLYLDPGCQGGIIIPIAYAWMEQAHVRKLRKWDVGTWATSQVLYGLSCLERSWSEVEGPTQVI